MNRLKGNKLVFFSLLIFVSLVILFSEFFHIETVPGSDDDCPICLWERTSLSIDVLNIFSCVLVLILISLVKDSEWGGINRFYEFKIRGRSPPILALY